MTSTPLRLAILDDYRVVVEGLAAMLGQYPDRVQVVEVAAGVPSTPEAPIDVVLYDAFAARARNESWPDLIGSGWTVRRIVLYTWDDSTDALPSSADLGPRPGREQDAAVHLSKTIDGEQLVMALEEIHATGTLTRPAPEPNPGAGTPSSTERSWPGKDKGLTEREAEILALIVEGLSNQDLADRLFLSINTVKSYIRTAYRTIGVTSRSGAVLWGVDHGLRRPRSGHQSS